MTTKLYLKVWFFRYLPEGVDAITIKDHILFRSDKPSENLIRHEMTHVEQYRKEGAVRFLTIYAIDYVFGRLRGLSHKEAYRAVRYEKEAYEKNPG